MKGRKLFVPILFALLALFGAGAAILGVTKREPQAAGDVNVTIYDSDAWYERMNAKYPNLFSITWQENQNDGYTWDSDGLGFSGVSGVRQANRHLNIHTRGGAASDIAIKLITGDTYVTGNNWKSFSDAHKEYFDVNGEVAYCFDVVTSALQGTHVHSGTLSEAGIVTGLSEDQVIELAEIAYRLTQDNFKAIKENAAQLAKSLNLVGIATDKLDKASNVMRYAPNITADEVKRALEDESADGLMFKRFIVQSLVWHVMNDYQWADASYNYLSIGPGYDKEGAYVPTSVSVITGWRVDIRGLVDFEKLKVIGKADTQHFVQEQLELTVGVPYEVPASKNPSYWISVANDNGNKIDKDGKVSVSINGDKITLTANEPILDWTEWLYSDAGFDEAIWSSKPYDMGHILPDGDKHPGSGQFIVNVMKLEQARVRVKASPNNTYVYVNKQVDASAASPVGAEYTFYSDAACTKSVGTVTIQTGGSSEKLMVSLGGSNSVTIYCKETKLPTSEPVPGGQWILDTTVYTVTLTYQNDEEHPGVVRASNDYEVRSYKVQLVKTVDPEGYSPKGAEYTVYADEACTQALGVLVVREDGTTNALTLTMPQGATSVTVYAKETKLPPNTDTMEWQWDTEIHSVTIEALPKNSTEMPINTFEAKNEAIEFGYFRIRKTIREGYEDMTKDNPLYTVKGCVFEVYDASGKLFCTLTTGEDGWTPVQRAPLGAYVGKEIKAPAGLKLDSDPFDIQVTLGTTADTYVKAGASNSPVFDPIMIEIDKGYTDDNEE